MRQLLPSPVLSAGLFLLWLLLNQPPDAAMALLGLLLALLLPLMTNRLRPGPVRVRRPMTALRLLGIVILDSMRSNFAVARGILTKRSRHIRSGFVHIPLDLRDPNALAVLAMIVCATPGTAWAELAFDRSVLLIHVLEVEDEAHVIHFIKTRYERPLMEIFE